MVLKEQLPHWRLPDQLTSLFDGFFHYSAREPALSAGAVRFIEEIRWFHFSIWESAAVCDELGDIIEVRVQSFSVILRHSYRLLEQSRDVYLAEISLLRDYVDL